MSRRFIMVALRTRRTTFIVLALVSVAAWFAAGSLGERALRQSEADAQAAARGFAAAGVASVLESDDLDGPIDGTAGADLLDRLQRGVLSEGTVFRMRVWSPQGQLLFTTDAGDESETFGDLPSVDVATTDAGRVTSRVVDDEVFETFVPLRLGQPDSLAAVQVDQGYAPILAKASFPWSLLRTIAAIAAGIFVLLAIVASLPIGVARNGGFVEEGEGPSEGGSSVSDEELADLVGRAEGAEAAHEEAQRRIGELETELQEARLEQERAAGPEQVEALRAELAEARAKAEQEARLAETADHTVLGFETRVRELEAELTGARARADEAAARVDEAVARAEEAVTRAEAAEARAVEVETRAAELEERAGHAESMDANASTLIAQLEGQLVEERGRAAELQTELDAERERDDGEARRARVAAFDTERRAADRDVELTAAQIRASAAERSAREAEERAAEAEARALAAEQEAARARQVGEEANASGF